MREDQFLDVTVTHTVPKINDDPRRTIVTMALEPGLKLPFDAVVEFNDIYFKSKGEVVGNHRHKWWEIFQVKPRPDVERVQSEPVLWLVWVSHSGSTRYQDIYVGDIIVVKPGIFHAFKVMGDPRYFFLGVLMDQAFYRSGVTSCDPPLIKG
ncbi:MAG: hypothetical protein NTV62_01790 [Candidatus Gribaldobacteria bacterium]|nr:hypothetical protein [Candidatus Gribaldobacteria bacterium]